MSTAGLSRSAQNPIPETFIGNILSIAIAVPLTIIAFLTVGYAVGMAGTAAAAWAAPHAWAMGRAMVQFEQIYLVNTRPDSYGYCWVMLILGIAMCIVLSILPRIFTGLAEYIQPAAILLVYLAGWAIWFPFLVAWIVKYFTVRVGGIEYTNKYLTPLAVGILIGSALVWPLVNIDHLLKILAGVYVR